MSSITDLLIPTILIEASPSNFTFMLDKVVLTIDTYFYVVIRDRKVYLATIGQSDETGLQHGAFRIELFNGDDSLPAEINRQDLFESFLTYGIWKCYSESRRLLRIRPKLIFKGVEAFGSIFHGLQQDAFEQAAQGVRPFSVKFD